MSPWHILGAGAIGSFVFLRMTQSQIPSVLLHHHKQRGSRLLIDGQSTTELPVTPIGTLPKKSIDRLLLTTKAGQIIEALQGAMPYLSDQAIIACTANGLGFDKAFGELLPNYTLHRAVSTAAAFRENKTRVHVVSDGSTRIGHPDSPTGAPDWFCDSLGTLEGWCWEPDMASAIGEKFSINCVINALTAKLECLNGQLLKGDRAGPELAALCQESTPALIELGLWNKERDLLSAAIKVCQSTATNQSSMLQDRLAGRPSEIEFLNAELLRRAGPLGLALPLNETLINTLR